MENNNCDSCYYCDSCNYCDSCYYCDSCDYCNYCNSCASCDFWNYCASCNYCDFCNSCYACKNLKMTENNYFCWSKEYGDENSVQQNSYRIFNVEVPEEEYHKVNKISHKLTFDPHEYHKTRFHTAFKNMWDNLTKEEKQEYFDIPHFDWEGFTFITGIEALSITK